MDGELSFVDASTVRNQIATHVLAHRNEHLQLGEICLRSQQVQGMELILRSIAMYGGALLCDEVGLGKTFTAIAVLRALGTGSVIAPAALIPMWSDSLRRAGSTARVYSLESFSRLHHSVCDSTLVIIDEAHHLRNSGTRRFRNIARFAENSRLLLLSATPVHNRLLDLTNLLSLFFGSRASRLSSGELSTCVVRRNYSGALAVSVPHRRIMPPVAAPFRADLKDAILSLHSPVPPRDGGVCVALLQFTLLRQWASSDAALRLALQKRLARARAMISAMEAGTYPTRDELRSWTIDGPVVQLVLAELLASPGGDRRLLAAVKAHEASTRSVLQMLHSGEPSDEWRARYLVAIRQQYGGRKVVVFTQFAATARAMFKLLRKEPGIGLVTAEGCDIASGRLPRREVLERFAPLGCRVAPPRTGEEVSLLIATDLCSEGLNLQDAGVVIHLDLPWTVARLEQRVGRVARSGSSHDEIFVHSIRTPRITEELLRIEKRLRTKKRLTESVIGSSDSAGDIHLEGNARLSVPETVAAIREILTSWTLSDGARPCPTQQRHALVSQVSASESGFLAVVLEGNRASLVCDSGDGATDDPRKILDRMRTFGIEIRPVDSARTAIAISKIDLWMKQRYLARKLSAPGFNRAHGIILRRIERTARLMPRHSRAGNAAKLDAARATMFIGRGFAGETRLENIARGAGDNGADRDDYRWLESVAELQNQFLKKDEVGTVNASGYSLLAMILGS